jgi:hypothetical protein
VVAKRHDGADQSFGSIAVAVLNKVLRPVLSEWHPALLDYEARRAPERPRAEHERLWERGDELREALGEVRTALSQYADLLAAVAGVEPIHGSGLAEDQRG